MPRIRSRMWKSISRSNIGSLEIDVHRNGKKYLTGFFVDPREFIVDYLWNQYKKRFPTPRRIKAVSIGTETNGEILSVDLLEARSFVVDEMEKDLIFPQWGFNKVKDLRLVRLLK